MSEASIRMASEMLSQSLTSGLEHNALKRERDEALARALAAEQLARDAVQAHADEETRADAAEQRLAALSQPETVREAVEALEEIANQEPVENILDPQWAARVARKALASLRERPRDGGWLPIDSAPKDGTPIVVYEAFGDIKGCFMDVVVWGDYGKWGENEGWVSHHDRSHSTNTPTHWKPITPLPAPPRTGEAG